MRALDKGKSEKNSNLIWGGKSSSLRNMGFTIVELLVALLLAAIVTSAAMSLYITQHKQLLVQGEVSDMQTSVRAATAELANKVRRAGYKIPSVVVPIIAKDTNPDTIVLAFDSGLAGDNILIEHDMPRPSAELRCDGHDLTGIYDDDWLYIYDPMTETGEFFLATHIQYASSNIQHNTMTLSKAYKRGSKVMKISLYKYFIDSSDPNHPNLMMQIGGGTPQIYAENITGLNFSYILSSGAIVDVPPLPDMIREVEIRVDARNDKADNDFFAPYRTRSLTTRIKVRNLGVN